MQAVLCNYPYHSMYSEMGCPSCNNVVVFKPKKTTATTGGDKVWIATKKLFVSLKEFIQALVDYCTY